MTPFPKAKNLLIKREPTSSSYRGTIFLLKRGHATQLLICELFYVLDKAPIDCKRRQGGFFFVVLPHPNPSLIQTQLPNLVLSCLVLIFGQIAYKSFCTEVDLNSLSSVCPINMNKGLLQFNFIPVAQLCWFTVKSCIIFIKECNNLILFYNLQVPL